MNKITIREIEKATEGKLYQGNEEETVNFVCTDSRIVEAGQLFIPIIGEVHDAHKFLPQVYQRGCRTFLVSERQLIKSYPDCNIIEVEDTLVALQKLSSYYLRKLNLKKVAVTGSVGKTSTRDMVYAILKSKYKTGTTKGNFNNDIGVPLTIFTFEQDMEAVVLEVGMDHFGEIHRLVDIIRPDIGIITNVGISHIENLGSREGILKAKMEITDFFTEDNCLVVNADCDMLSTVSGDSSYDLIKVGSSCGSEYMLKDICDHGDKGVSYQLLVEGKVYDVRLSIPGAHNALNSALAIAACRKLGVTIEQAIQALSNIRLTGKRLTLRENNHIKVIDDTYNAAPDSMKSAIRTLMNTDGSRKIAILGGMNELGEDSPLYHRQVGEFAREQKIDFLLTVGEKAEDIATGFGKDQGGSLHFKDKEELYKSIDKLFRKGDIILVKGSRTMQMEQVVERILKEQE